MVETCKCWMAVECLREVGIEVMDIGRMNGLTSIDLCVSKELGVCTIETEFVLRGMKLT